jgi:hypothetical protein
MLKKQLGLLFALVLTFPLAAVVFAHQESAKKAPKEARWVSQYHADKKVNDIDPSQVKEEDYVICKGTAEKAGVVHATLISKRLSHSQ